ncbi:MAG: lycopene cyclase domain-containing protein [Burkholderiaceae bacterium]
MAKDNNVISEDYVWIVWSSAFVIPWAIVYTVFPVHRRQMMLASLFTAPFGLTEPLFVPEYWSPPSLFDLAIRTGFDIESVIFSFGIGGIGAVLYNLITRQQPACALLTQRRHPHHRYHLLALTIPFLSFPVLYFLPWNPIYPAIVAMALGAFTTIQCRPDLLKKTGVGGLVFLAYYIVFLIGLEWIAPGYIQRVWNLGALSGLSIIGMPIEELAFAVAFGAYWAGVYEHITWKVLVSPSTKNTASEG